MADKRLDRLTEACKNAIERFKPDPDGTTYCNSAVAYVFRAFKYTGFDGLLANAIIDKAMANADFSEVTPEIAQKLANDGRLVLAGCRGRPHGHVAACYPGALFYSGKWRSWAPFICNVGHRNAIMSANYGFTDAPKYWAFIGQELKDD